VGGRIGGASGKAVVAGDKILCTADSNGGAESACGARFVVKASAYVLAAARTVLAAESGATFYLNLAGGFTVTMPTAALGLCYTFIVKTQPTTAYIIDGNGTNNVIGSVFESTGGSADYDADGDTLEFVAATALPSDRAEFVSDGTNWLVTAHCRAVGGITITD